MKRKKLNVKRLWVQFEDFLFPRLRLSITDRAVYLHLLRHTRLEGRLQLHFSMPWLARGIGISTGPVRESVRRLVVLGALRLIRRSKAGHVIDVLLPDEIRGLRPGSIPARGPARQPQSANLEALDFLKTRALRQSIHLRERGHCFYCLRRTTSAELNARLRALDALASGKLPPPVLHPDTPIDRKGRPPGTSSFSRHP